jgi:hypothetical protein
LIAEVEDIDNRRALLERVTSSVARLLPDKLPKPARKRRAEKAVPQFNERRMIGGSLVPR